MSPGADQYRLAVAIFDDPLSLLGAIGVLMSDGVALEQVCLLAFEATMSRLTQSRDGAAVQPFAGLLTDLRDWHGRGDGRDIVATSGPLLHRLLEIRDRHPVARSDGSRAPMNRPDLDDQIRQDAFTLVVRSATPAQQSMTTRTLLSQSTHRVKTYVFTLGDSAAGSTGH